LKASGPSLASSDRNTLMLRNFLAVSLQLVFQGTDALLGAGEQLTREAAISKDIRVD
jgi:hypothetical protein